MLDMCECTAIKAYKTAMKSNQNQMHLVCRSPYGLGHPKDYTSEGLHFSSSGCFHIDLEALISAAIEASSLPTHTHTSTHPRI